MAQEKLLTIRDVAIILGISEKEVIDLSESGAMPAYKIGGVYLRFKREQIEEFKKSLKYAQSKLENPEEKLLYAKVNFNDRVKDFFYFNDFYIVSILIILITLLVIFKG